jgi:serine/threonine protein kinase
MIGQNISHFRVLEKLGSGGMGVVYLAEDMRLKRTVVLKFLPLHLNTDEEAKQRFVQEAQSASALNHPNICTIHEIGETEPAPGESGGQMFIAMAHYSGETLKEKLGQGPVPVDEAVRIAQQISDGLAAAHEHGIVHRDIKPANIIVTEDGRAVILDFGLAKLTGAVDLTKTGSTLGTIAYMSPEQVRGESLDPRTDLWSLGVCLFEMLTNSRPFKGDYDQAIAYSILNEEPPPVGSLRESVPPELESIVGMLLRKEPASRFRDARELEVTLIGALSDSAALLASTSGRRLPSSLKWAAIGVATLLAIGLPFVVSRTADEGTIEVTRTWQVTHAPGLEVDPALSPDGNLLAYSSGPEGDMRIHIRQVQGGRTITLTDDVPGNHRWPRWSPDGSKILFQSEGAVFVVPSLGGFAKRIISMRPGEGVYGADWSPDGSEVAYAKASGIEVKDLDSGEVVSEFAAFEPHSPAWSPDGRNIAFVSGNPFFVFGTASFANLAASTIWIGSTDGTEPVRITMEDGQAASPIWKSDGRYLMWVSNIGGSRDVYRVRIDDTSAPRGDTHRLTTGLDAHSISIAQDGRTVAYSSFQATANVWSVQLPAVGSVSVSSAVPITTGNQRIESINVSHDEQWLAFDSDLAGNQDIYVMPLAGGEPIQLTTDPADDFSPSWSPDGQSVAFHSFRDGNRELYVVSVVDRAVERVTNHPSQDRAPDWSPDGRRLTFFSDRTGRQELYTIERQIDGWAESRQLTLEGGLHAEWSPDSDMIVYISGSRTHNMSSSVHELRVVSAAGGEPVVLVSAREAGLPAAEAPEWSTDGRSVYYKAFDDEGGASIWRVPAAGGDPEPIVLFDDPRRRTLYRHELAVDRKNVYFTIGDFESDIWMMEFADQK